MPLPRPMTRAGLRVLMTVVCLAAPAAIAEEETLQHAAELTRFADLALDCVHREYPNKISHAMASDADAAPPRVLTPAFYGCFDWHSAVHGHWLLARLARLHPQASFAARARGALAESLTAGKIEGELAYFAGPGRAGFERPYGLAWLLQLAAELREWDDPSARRWVAVLAPLEDVVERRFTSWLPSLAYPVRSGTHNQSAFGFALALDWARIAGRDALARMLEDTSRRFYGDDRACPLAYEPSGEDFLSPCLMEADLMRRVIAPAAYPGWLSGFLPDIPRDPAVDWLEPAVVLDPADGKLVHLDGVNLSRAWNLEAIAASLPQDDGRRGALLKAAGTHRQAGLAAVTGEHYAGAHWLASFATYLLSGKALEASGPRAGDR